MFKIKVTKRNKLIITALRKHALFRTDIKDKITLLHNVEICYKVSEFSALPIGY